MIQLDELRRRQQERLLPAMDVWNEARKNLAAATALAELREKEYLALSQDVCRRLDAMQLVFGMVQETEKDSPKPAAAEPEVRAIGEPPRHTAAMRTSSQKLFPAAWREKYAELG